MFNRHLSTYPKCLWGYSKETAEHYFLLCPNCNNIRASMILTLPSNQTDTRTLLYGSLELRYFENEHIFITVQKFIKKCKAVNNNIKRCMKKANENWIGEQCSEIEENLRKNNSKRAYQLVKDLTTVKQRKASTVQDGSGKCLTERATDTEPMDGILI